ncbi:hypothetical protein OG741_14630 [Streptomyces sp. NBC_01410]|uniref:hypothetical protein n=1 Tax=Streptomyces sp. NBC_01410 TaxID=2903856 RepID=UPI00324ED7BF
MTTPSNDRVLLISGIAVNAASIVAAIAAPLANLPDGVRFTAVGLVGVTATGLAWKFATVDRAALARRLLLISCVLVTLLGAVLAWPGGPPVGSFQEDRRAEQKGDGGTEQSNKNSSTEAKLTETVAQLKRGIQQPSRDSDVHSCITVSGDGRIPDGYGLWVANLPDVGGSADMGALNNLQRVNQADGEMSWQTPNFGVGLGKRDAGTDYWLYVFLLPEAADSALRNLRTETGTSLTAPVEGALPVDRYRVTRTATWNCPYKEKP